MEITFASSVVSGFFASSVLSLATILVRHAILVRRYRESIKEQRHHKLHRPPGIWMLNVGRLFASKKINSQLIEPLVADLQFEYFETLSLGQRSIARSPIITRFLIIVRYYLAFLTVFVIALTGWSGAAAARTLATMVGGGFMGWQLAGSIGMVVGVIVGATANAYRNRQLEQMYHSEREQHS